MITKDTGGPAFPRTQYPNETGMTLRDYFAAKALQGLLADPEPFEDCGEGLPMAYAYEAYVYADAMLRAREAA
jgi:hypothetical protein